MEHKLVPFIQEYGRNFLQLEEDLQFVKQVLYPGRVDESLVAKRIRLNEGQKTKSSLTMLPDLSSITKELKRATGIHLVPVSLPKYHISIS